MFIKQVSVFLENAHGRLNAVTGILEEAGVNIRAFAIADTESFGIMRLIVDEPAKAEKILKDKGVTAVTGDVIVIKIEDRPGALHSALGLIQKAGISVEYAYAYLTRAQGEAYIVLKTSDDARAADSLVLGGVCLL